MEFRGHSRTYEWEVSGRDYSCSMHSVETTKPAFAIIGGCETGVCGRWDDIRVRVRFGNLGHTHGGGDDNGDDDGGDNGDGDGDGGGGGQIEG